MTQHQEDSPIKKWESAIEDVEKGQPLCTGGGNADWYSHCGKQSGDISKIKMDLPFDPTTPFWEYI